MKSRIITNGLSIGIERHQTNVYFLLKATGTLTRQDFEIVSPVIDSALQASDKPRARALIDATELDKWDAKAAWYDLKLCLKHGREFEKVAVYGNKKWQHKYTKIANWFMGGKKQFFEDKDRALEWLSE
ncbi:STAS/SEC14 domain-containing protein [Kangiella sp. TOML190]|uniref:STAS/SEC14 domain-containing protein n=1 Tax=Kangiella sp. TOML190 TaxID=2931351 RepID=UPI00203A7B4C|nr:STAS/SEC14 domain-containing protein [Kangiella sp. TOML190]